MILCTTFSADRKLVGCGYASEFRVMSCETLQLKLVAETKKPVHRLVLISEELAGVVHEEEDEMHLWSYSANAAITTLKWFHPIQWAQMGGGRLFVLTDHLTIWDCKTGLTQEVKEIKSDSPKTPCALSPTGKTLAIRANDKVVVWNVRDIEAVRAPPIELMEPGDSSVKTLQIPDDEVKAVKAAPRPVEIRAHKSPVSTLCLSDNLLVTASDTGTVIRVFDVKTRQLSHELRRGMSPSMVRVLDLHTDEKWVLASTMQGKIHVFALARPRAFDLDGWMRPRALAQLSFSKTYAHCVQFSNKQNTFQLVTKDNDAMVAGFNTNKAQDAIVIARKNLNEARKD